MSDPWKQEIIELHDFFERWMRGDDPLTDDAFQRVRAVLADGFELIHPEGRRIEREPLLDRLRKAHGSRPEKKIWIEAPRLQFTRGVVQVATYEEWQEDDNGRDGRLSTAVFQRVPDAPNGLVWRHVHETWLEPPSSS